MSFFQHMADRFPFSKSSSLDLESHESLGRATYIELFFDLVFIFCIRSILPVITHVDGEQVDWYSYYTFWFTFTLMLQIWFNSTIFMNRFGTGRAPDIAFLTTNMFLLFIMTRAIDTGWEYYSVYNISWVLIIVNTIAHWAIRYRHIANPSNQIKGDTLLAVITLGIQAMLVMLSQLMPKTPAEVTCLVALLLGFVFWNAGSKDRLDEKNREHLAERCALLMVLTFGETLIGFGTELSADMDLFVPIVCFLLILGMFLVYLNEIINLVDLNSLGGGRRYMALSAWMTFCVANVTAGFEMAAKGMSLMGMEGDSYFGISVVVFLLSFFLYIPFNKYKRPPLRWIIARIVACLFVLLQTSDAATGMLQLLLQTSMSSEALSVFYLFAVYAMIVVAVAAVYAVLAIDRIAVRREQKKSAAEVQNQLTNAKS